ncbi:MAG: GDSL-type esterase/lipase family protein [Clostridiales bacterium]|jgi:lysophospholipase L1-like esterase|nr:GDSL-type esterase/lipase family protein [Clostridiales bacterium]
MKNSTLSSSASERSLIYQAAPKKEVHWVGTWGASQYCGDNSNDAGKASALVIGKTLPGKTLRQIIRITAGGSWMRFSFSNEYGKSPVEINAAHIAKAAVPAKSNIDVLADTPLAFSGKKSVIIPAGETVTSDEVYFPANPLERIAVSLFFGEMPDVVTCHVASRAYSFVEKGNAVSNSVIDGDVNTHWFVLSGAEILAPLKNKSVIAFGDSITDGYGVTDETYTRWTDILAQKLQENVSTAHLSVINMGIGTNALLNQTNPPAAISRFSRDVLNQPGAGYMVFLIGANDIPRIPDTVEFIAALDEIIQKSQDKGIKVFGGTILPQGNFENIRHEINGYLRGLYAAGKLYALADFDELMKNPENPMRMLPIYDNDGLHPSLAGYKAMGEYVYSLLSAEK